MKIFSCLILPTACLFLAGCGSNQVPLGGKVTFQDGKPLKTGVVCFSTGTFMAEGRLNENGEYTVGSLKDNDGLPPGTYKVYIQGAIEYNAKEQGVSLIHKKFTEPNTTPFSFEAKKSGDKTFNIEVSPP
ncbi:MAG: YgdI/YgdR family lipoprotein, partial [Planctomycetaceae bacterium]|nr:YgdI/YgdR family lipoprotein [Planctomycetaceae bacterium]